MAFNAHMTQYPIYQPASRAIIAITNANPAQVTTSIDGVVAGNHLYKDGTIVRLLVPEIYGMFQVNNLYAPIVVTSPTTFTIDLDTTFFDAFVVPAARRPDDWQWALVIPIGELNETLLAATQNVLPYP